MTTIQDLTIDRLGGHGDGIAQLADGPVYIPYVLSGETVRAEVSGDRARLLEIITPSPDRIAPTCPHFTACGGCASQHMARTLEQAIKVEQVRIAFSQQRITAPMLPMIAAELGSRRRAVFAARRTKNSAVFGFHAARAHDIIDIDVCPILSPEIAQRLPAIKTLITPLLSRSGEARITVTVADNGIDIAVEGAKPELTAELRQTLADHARAARVIRVSIDTDPVYASLQPLIRFGRVDVAIPPGVFLQAVPAAERAIADLLRASIGKTKAVADLFCGVGTFSFPLAEGAQVLAVDSDKAAIAALSDAHRRGQGVKPVITKVRDLLREPMSAKELEPYEAVVFDPPRSGADAQAHMIAKSKAKTVVAISCAPATLARDVKTLIAAGFMLESVTPIDQFVFTPHVEALAVLRRKK
jgi:23S rRNA (uracil1939-C5)-methyltransferase